MMKKVIVRNYANHCPMRNVDGGAYKFVTVLERTDDGMFEISYYSSSDFEYCPVYGYFTTCETCPDWDVEDGCTAQLHTITEKELLNMLHEYQNDPLLEIEIDGNVIKPAVSICGMCYPDGECIYE